MVVVFMGSDKTDTEVSPGQVRAFPGHVFLGIIDIHVTAATIRSDASSPPPTLRWEFGVDWFDMLCRVRYQAGSISRTKFASVRLGLFA